MDSSALLAVFGISQPPQICHLTTQSSTVAPSIWPIFIVKSAAGRKNNKSEASVIADKGGSSLEWGLD